MTASFRGSKIHGNCGPREADRKVRFQPDEYKEPAPGGIVCRAAPSRPRITAHFGGEHFGKIRLRYDEDRGLS